MNLWVSPHIGLTSNLNLVIENRLSVNLKVNQCRNFITLKIFVSWAIYELTFLNWDNIEAISLLTKLEKIINIRILFSKELFYFRKYSWAALLLKVAIQIQSSNTLIAILYS